MDCKNQSAVYFYGAQHEQHLEKPDKSCDSMEGNGTQQLEISSELDNASLLAESDDDSDDGSGEEGSGSAGAFRYHD